MAKKRGRESNVGLVVTLIFFILLSIGLGVATYYGFAQQDKLTKDAAAATTLKNEADDLAKWYKFQAWTLRADLGQTEGVDDTELGVLRQNYEGKQLGKSAKDHDAVEKAIGAIESKKYRILAENPKTKALEPVDVTMGWGKKDKDGKPTPRPVYTFEDIYTGLTQLLDSQTKAADTAAKAQAEADAGKTKAQDELAKAQKDYKAELDKLTAQNNADLAKERADNDALRKQLEQSNKEKGDAVLAGEDKLKTKQKEITARDTQLKELQQRLDDLNQRIAQNDKAQQETPSGGKPIPTDYKIVQMDRSGKEPFVNLGHADGVKPGLTFSIHGQGSDGRPTPASKGTLEVINVVNDHLSQAQVVSVKDAQKDPILQGDYLYNPVFKPGGEQHVVIAGRIDMHGTRGDDLQEFERLLQRHNVVVDGYVDPQDGSVKGKLSVNTDYLVLGDIGSASEPAQASIKQLQEQARNNGVHIVSAREFLDSMGYHTP